MRSTHIARSLAGTLVLALALGTAQAAVTESELMQAAVELAHAYDTHYAERDAAAMAALYAPDGILVSPSGPLVRGQAALETYYKQRFASGARQHQIKVLEVHVQGDGGFSVNRFSVLVPKPDGTLHEEDGTIVAVYQRDDSGWHMRILEPSVPAQAPQ